MTIKRQLLEKFSEENQENTSRTPLWAPVLDIALMLVKVKCIVLNELSLYLNCNNKHLYIWKDAQNFISRHIWHLCLIWNLYPHSVKSYSHISNSVKLPMKGPKIHPSYFCICYSISLLSHSFYKNITFICERHTNQFN